MDGVVKDGGLAWDDVVVRVFDAVVVRVDGREARRRRRRRRRAGPRGARAAAVVGGAGGEEAADVRVSVYCGSSFVVSRGNARMQDPRLALKHAVYYNGPDRTPSRPSSELLLASSQPLSRSYCLLQHGEPRLEFE